MPPLEGKLYPRILNDFVHDVAAGMYPGLALTAWLVRSSAASSGTSIATVTEIGGTLTLLMVLTAVVSITTGLIRLRYWKLNIRAGFLETKGQMAAMKHGLFVLVLIASGFLLGAAVN